MRRALLSLTLLSVLAACASDPATEDAARGRGRTQSSKDDQASATPTSTGTATNPPPAPTGTGTAAPPAPTATGTGTAAPPPAPTGTGTGTPPPPAPITLAKSDVSILYPLPSQAAELEAMLATSSSGEQGPLLTPTLFNAAIAALRLEVDVFGTPPDSLLTATTYSSLRLVALRMDPCFGGNDPTAASCEAQVRAIYQPIVPDGSGKSFVALDAAVHVFYKLSKAELLAFTKSVVALRDESGGYVEGPLGPHPLLVKEGLAGKFGKGLSQLVLATLGSSRVNRVTVFARMNKNQDGVDAENQVLDWRFAAVDGAGAPLRPLNNTVDLPFQGLRTRGDARPQNITAPDPPPPPPPPPPAYYGTPTNNPTPPIPQTPPETESLVRGDEGLHKDDEKKGAIPKDGAFGTKDQKALEISILRTSLRMENPMAHSPDSTDCSSCHVAQPLRTRGEVLGIDPKGFGDFFTGSKRPLVSASSKTTSLHNLHAFSYVGKDFAVNQRTVNESALVADSLEAALKLGWRSLTRSRRACLVTLALVSLGAGVGACGGEDPAIIESGGNKRGKGGSNGAGGRAGGSGKSGAGGLAGSTSGNGGVAGASGGFGGSAGSPGGSGGAASGSAGSGGSGGGAGSAGGGSAGSAGSSGNAGTSGAGGMVPTATTTMEPPKPPPLSLAKSDVAILYPLPTKLSEMSQLIAPTAGIADGSVLLPPALFAAAINALDLKKGVSPFGVPKAPALTTESYSSLRLVAIRLVPCGPPLSLVDGDCQSVVRLTLQPVIPAPDGSGFVALNGSVQIIFSVPLPDLVSLAKEIGALVTASKGYVEGPLGIHPLLVREGYVGPFGEGLRKAVLGKLSPTKLKRVAVLTNLSDDGQPPPATGAIQFRFAAVGVDGGFVRIGNHEAASPYQGVYASTAGKGTGVGGLGNTPVGGAGDPRTYGPAGYSAVAPETECLIKQLAGYDLGGPAPPAGAPDIADGSAGKATALQKQAYRSSLRLENPTLHQTDSTDCTSCHLAGAFRARSEGEGLATGSFPAVFTSPRPLDRASPKTISIQNFHAFAYAGVDLSVSQRVTNEAAGDADALEKAANAP